MRLFIQKPPFHFPYVPGENKIDSVDRSLSAREQTIHLLEENLFKAQNRMTQLADEKRTERTFTVRDWV